MAQLDQAKIKIPDKKNPFLAPRFEKYLAMSTPFKPWPYGLDSYHADYLALHIPGKEWKPLTHDK